MASTTAIKSEIKGEEGIGSGSEKFPNEDQRTADKNKMESQNQKVTETQKVETEEPEFEIVSTNCTEEKKDNTITKEPVQAEITKPGKPLVDVAPIKESSEKDELATALQNMPGMTKSKSREILKALDEKEISEIAEELAGEKEKEDGSMIDISIVEESDTEKEVQEVIKEAQSGFQAEILEENEEIAILPAEHEEVVEYTIEMKHVIPIITVMVAFIAVFFALIFHYHI